MELIRAGYPQPAGLDTAVSRAILMEVSRGERGETLRLHRPGAVVAFGPKDRLAPGFEESVKAAAARGFGAIQRLGGGRAAVFHEETIAFSWAVPDPSPSARIRDRFARISSIVAEALCALGVDARVGEVPGEYCPAEFSVNARGAAKIMGVGQRLAHRAAHVGGVIVVGASRRVRDVLVPVYRALGLPWDAETVGSVQDEVPTVGWVDVEASLLEAFAARFHLSESDLAPGTLAMAKALARDHEILPSPAPADAPAALGEPRITA